MTLSRPQPQSPSRSRSRRAVLLMLPSAIVVAGVVAEAIREVRSRPGNPDPGNRLLNALAVDPVFTVLPPGAVRTSRQKVPATYRTGSLFEGGTWDGPAVIMTFTSAQSVRDVYGFYAELAHDAGWTPWQQLSMGFIGSWTKKIAAQRSVVSLVGESFDIHAINVAESGTPRSYSLST